MKSSIIRLAAGVVLGVGALALADAQPAQAQWYSPYRFCADYADREGMSRDCSFDTWWQCQATISGVGGRCFENPNYGGPIPPPQRRKKRRR